MTADADQEKFLEGWAYHQKGQVAKAREIYAQVLARQPRHFDALNLSGILAAQAGNFAEAVDLISRAVAINPNNAGAHYNLGLAFGHLGRHQEALASHARATALKPDYAEAYVNHGNALRELRQAEAAVASYDNAIRLKPNLAEAHNNRGNALKDLQRLEEAADSFERAATLNPGNAEIHLNRAGILSKLGRLQEALSAYDKAVAANPDFAEAYNDRGIVLVSLGQPQAAVASYDSAIRARSGFVEAYGNRGAALRRLGRLQDAVASYDKALEIDPARAVMYNSRGAVLMDMGAPDKALADYDRSIALDPGYAEAYNNRGTALLVLKRPEAALQSYERAAQLKPQMAHAHFNRGNTLVELKQHVAAIACFDRALEIEPQFPYLYGTRLNTRMLVCDWKGIESELTALTEKLERRERCTPPFQFLALAGASALHAIAAEVWAQDKLPPSAALSPIPPRARGYKIRIGYFSMDFRNHPVALLMAELIEKHDRARFEIYGFSYGPDTGDDLRKRLEKSFDKFIDVRTQSNRQIVDLARRENIDIAVDLGGYTNDSRTAMFAMRLAPVQANYLGYPGTIGADFMDYIIADATVIPTEDRQYYAEKVVHMPDSYQVNDSKRRVVDKVYSRTELGLPDSGFVFCCFNNNYKITPVTFNNWVRILKQVKGSVLWLLDDNATASQNLRKEAERRGVNGSRIIFAGRMPLPDHLARHRAADLFLDTLPYNAHTTASDALWAGLPVLTCLGEGFPGRVAASLLKAIGLPELITTTVEDYRTLAVELATNPARLAALKQKLADNRPTAPLFDAGRFARHIEQAYSEMIARHDADLPPDHIVIKP